MTKLVFISDTHNRHKKIKLPDGDILVHCGDATSMGEIHELQQVIDWFKKLLDVGKYKDIIYISGNHDFGYQEMPALMKDMTKGVGHYLEDKAVTVQGLKFYGSPWSPLFFEWAYNLPRGEALKEKWDMIPANTDVLITHTPPFGIGDLVNRSFTTSYDPPNFDGHTGCRELLEAVKKLKPKIHAYGHIHDAYGTTTIGGTTFVNAATCDDKYQAVHEPIVVEV